MKQRISFAVIALTMCGSSALAQDTRPSRGAGDVEYVFTSDSSYPTLGEAWREPVVNGIEFIWGDVATTDAGAVLYLSQSAALRHCLNLNPQPRRRAIARALQQGRLPQRGVFLPRRVDFIRLREYMGAAAGTFTGYTAQVLPHLAEQYFWSSTKAARYGGMYAFDGRGGGITDYDDEHQGYAFRCAATP